MIRASIHYISAATRLSSDSCSERNDEPNLVVQSITVDQKRVCDAEMSIRVKSSV